MVDVAQLVRASVCGTEGCGFESHLPPHTSSQIKNHIYAIYLTCKDEITLLLISINLNLSSPEVEE